MDKLPEMVQIAQDIEELKRVVQEDADVWLNPAATHRIAKQMGALLVALKLQAADIKRLTPLADIGVAISRMKDWPCIWRHEEDAGPVLAFMRAYEDDKSVPLGFRVTMMSYDYDYDPREDTWYATPEEALAEAGLMEVSNDN